MYRQPNESSPLLITAFHGRVFGIDRQSGEIIWKVKMGTAVDMGEAVELAVDDDVVVACTRNGLAFIDYQTGTVHKLIQRDDVASGARRPTMIIDGNRIFVTGFGALACYTVKGDLVWEQRFKSEGFGDLAIGFPHKVRQADMHG
jgi:outer membrane protein assembly factor BamB